MAKVHVGQPLDADEDLIGVVPPRQLELLPLRRPAPHEDRVVVLTEQSAHTRHGSLVPNVDPHVQYHLRLLIEHFGGQAERRNVHAHQAASGLMRFVDDHLVADGHEVVGDRQRRRPRADERNPLAVLLRRDRW